jgi:hypothetical protein
LRVGYNGPPSTPSILQVFIMSRRRRLVALSILYILSSPTTAVAASPADAGASSILPQGKSGTALVDQVIGQVGSLGNYKFEGSQEAHTGNKVLKAKAIFYFRPANSMRVEVQDFGAKSGSILIKAPGGQIKAKGGPRLFGMSMALQPDSRLLKMPNGLSAVECDLGTLLKRIKRQADAGYKVVAGNEPMNVEGLGGGAIVVETVKADGSAGPVADRVFIDPVKKLPLQWDLFENGQLQSRSKFENYQTNLQLDDSQFKI